MDALEKVQQQFLEIDIKKAMNSKLISAHIVCETIIDILKDNGAQPIELNMWNAHSMRFKTELQLRNFPFLNYSKEVFNIVKFAFLLDTESIKELPNELLAEMSEKDILTLVDILLEDFVRNEDVLILLTDELNRRK